MNYVILNKVKSTTVKGLLIQSLPAISKPLMRTAIETIDGRDGDIVRNQGYSAYNKTMEIGLFGDFSIDQVIQYFASEGTVIFSNEPDKYYRYKIIDQIDFERLLRFRTATVTLHVQPFKYSAVDDNYTVRKDKITVKPYESIKGGLTVTAENGIVFIKGTSTATLSFYLPIDSYLATSGTYNLVTDISGSASGSLRIIDNQPNDAESLGGTLYPIGDNDVDITQADDLECHYLYLSVSAGTHDATLTVSVLDESWNSVKLFNRGNVDSRPTITFYGLGTVNLSINGVQLFTLNISDYITLNGEDMNAYRGDTLKNRFVSGDMSKFKLKPGANTLSWTGTITRLDIADESRWL